MGRPGTGGVDVPFGIRPVAYPVSHQAWELAASVGAVFCAAVNSAHLL